MNEIKKTLKDYGLDHQESTIYLHLLSRIESSAYKIAKELNIPRATVYNKLSSLVEQGLVASSKTNNVRHYTPESLNSFLSNLDAKRARIENIIPKLKEIKKSADLKKPQVRFYVGKKGMKLIWDEMIETYKSKNIKEIYATSHSELYKIFPRYFKEWTKQRINFGVTSKLIRKKSDFELSYEKSIKHREFRFVDDKYLSESEITTFGDKTAIFSFKKNKLQTIVVESKELTDTFNRLLQFMWDHSEKHD